MLPIAAIDVVAQTRRAMRGALAGDPVQSPPVGRRRRRRGRPRLRARRSRRAVATARGA